MRRSTLLTSSPAPYKGSAQFQGKHFTFIIFPIWGNIKTLAFMTQLGINNLMGLCPQGFGSHVWGFPLDERYEWYVYRQAGEASRKSTRMGVKRLSRRLGTLEGSLEGFQQFYKLFILISLVEYILTILKHVSKNNTHSDVFYFTF